MIAGIPSGFISHEQPIKILQTCTNHAWLLRPSWLQVEPEIDATAPQFRDLQLELAESIQYQVYHQLESRVYRSAVDGPVLRQSQQSMPASMCDLGSNFLSENPGWQNGTIRR